MMGSLARHFALFSFAVILALIALTADCVAQDSVITDFTIVDTTLSGTYVYLAGNTVPPGGSSTVTITIQSGGYFAPAGNNPLHLAVSTWPGYSSDDYSGGAPDSNAAISNFQVVDPTDATFTLTVGAGAAQGVDMMMLGEFGGCLIWPIFIQPPLPPKTPNPPYQPGPSDCGGTPQITSVTPEVWWSGKKMPITITGSGFVTQTMADANSNCVPNQLTVSVPTGSVTLSDVNIIDSNTITARVEPADTDPEETATVILWGASNIVVAVAKAPSGVGAMTTLAAATPADGGVPPGMDPLGQETAQLESLPISETSSLASADDIKEEKDKDPGNTGTLYKAQLFGKSSDVKFDGRTVRELDAGGGVSNGAGSKGKCDTDGLVSDFYFRNPKILIPGNWQVAGRAGNNQSGDYTALRRKV